MKNKGIVIFLIILVVVMVAVVVTDFSSTRPDKQPANPYALNMDEFKKVDPKLIIFKETEDFKLNLANPAGIAYKDSILYVVGDSSLLTIQKDGRLISRIQLDDDPACITVGDGKIFIGFTNHIASYDLNGKLIKDWGKIDDKSVLTSLAVWKKELFAADAGLRKVYRYSTGGYKIAAFEGKHEEDALHGFIVPSPYFDLAFSPYGELWIVNPGNHSLENYTLNGDMRGFWKHSSNAVDGFSGCCNPAQFTFLPDGSFVTSEKGLVRIKIYKASGEFEGVVAAPDKFTDDGHAPDVASDEEGNVYALDFDKNMIRVFVPK